MLSLVEYICTKQCEHCSQVLMFGFAFVWCSHSLVFAFAGVGVQRFAGIGVGVGTRCVRCGDSAKRNGESVFKIGSLGTR